MFEALKDLKDPQRTHSHAPLEDHPLATHQRAICTVLLDPQDPLLQSERAQGFIAGPVCGRAKCLHMLGVIKN